VRSSVRFCSSCGARLVRRRLAGHFRRVCPRCGQVAYENAKPCAGALVERRGRLLLARRAVPPYKGWWDIPGGFLEADEHPEDGARREVHEETGLRVRILGLLGIYLDRYGGSPVMTLYYLARPVGGRERPADDAAELRWFARDELPRQIAFPGHVQKVLQDWLRIA
jgi:8-oxo-dGTP diphosphatase